MAIDPMRSRSTTPARTSVASFVPATRFPAAECCSTRANWYTARTSFEVLEGRILHFLAPRQHNAGHQPQQGADSRNGETVGLRGGLGQRCRVQHFKVLAGLVALPGSARVGKLRGASPFPSSSAWPDRNPVTARAYVCSSGGLISMRDWTPTTCFSFSAFCRVRCSRSMVVAWIRTCVAAT